MKCCDWNMNAAAKHAPNGVLIIKHWCVQCGAATFSIYDPFGSWIVTDNSMAHVWKDWGREDVDTP